MPGKVAPGYNPGEDTACVPWGRNGVVGNAVIAYISSHVSKGGLYLSACDLHRFDAPDVMRRT